MNIVNTDTTGRTVNLYLKSSGGVVRRIIPKNMILKAVILIKKGIFDKMEYPWFRPLITECEKDNIQIRDISTENVAFCLNAKELGHKVLIDTTIRVGHEKKAIW